MRSTPLCLLYTPPNQRGELPNLGLVVEALLLDTLREADRTSTLTYTPKRGLALTHRG